MSVTEFNARADKRVDPRVKRTRELIVLGPGSLTAPALYMPPIFRELGMPETGMPRITVVGSLVSEKNSSRQLSE
jgi:hypothetical protein